MNNRLLAARHVIGPLHRLRGMLASNVFVLDGGPGDRFLIDTGHVLERPALLLGLRALPFPPSALTGILLTHHHSDHAGNAAFLRERFRVPVLAHRADADVLEGLAAPPTMAPRSADPLVRAFAALESGTRTRVAVDRALGSGDAAGSLEVHHAPGHTRGSLLFRHEGTLSLLSGDALLAAVPPLTITQRMCLPHPSYAASYGDALGSLARFLREGHPFDNLLAGHGRPILGDARARAERLLDDAAPKRATEVR